MKLLTKGIAKSLPPIYSTENSPLQLEDIRGPGWMRVLGVERDRYWKPKRFGDIDLKLRM